MRFQDEQFSAASNYGPVPGPFVSPQQLARLVIAARALQQDGGPSAAAGPPSGQAPRAFVLAPTDPFAAGVGGASGAEPAGPRASALLASPDTAKAAAILSLRQAQANPPASATQTQASPQPTLTPRKSGDAFPKLETPSADDIANGHYMVVGFRHLLRNDPSKALFHTYARIPVIVDGKPRMKDGKPELESVGVLGDPGSRKNQQVRVNDFDQKWGDRNSQ